MKTVHVNTACSYDVLIGSGLLRNIGSHIAAIHKPCNLCIVSDSNVWPIYGETLKKSLHAAGFSPISFVFPAGEESKNPATYLQLLNFLAENHITRTDLIVALGGGVVGDLAGFAAASYLRGIPFVQVPTTLLAAVDSSVGGKTAIDLPAGKNLVGAFYQPSLVLCDVDCLNTLPSEIFRDGCAEVIKYGILYDPELFAHLSQHGLSFHREETIARCVELKRDVVAEDEFDTGARMKLNLGHTIGHAIEARSNFTATHGCAVAMGMAIVARAGAKLGICAEPVRDAIETILEQFGLPTAYEDAAETLTEAALSDKKRAGGTIRLIVPESIGSCIIRPTPVEELRSFIQAGL